MSEIQVWKQAIGKAKEKFVAVWAEPAQAERIYQREAMFALQMLEDKEKLRKCSPESIRNAVINVANVGITLSPALKLAYLVPRDGKCCLDISYIGLVKIATDSGSVLAVKAEMVRSGDQFEYRGPFEAPLHKFSPFDPAETRGEVIGVYVIAKLRNNIVQIETLGIEEINKIRSASKAQSGPWAEWFEEMAKKAAIKRASKMWPRTDMLSMAEEVLNEHEGNEGQLGPKTIDADPEGAQELARQHDEGVSLIEKLLAQVKAASNTDQLTKVWQDGIKQTKECGDISIHNAFKESVTKRGAELRAAEAAA